MAEVVQKILAGNPNLKGKKYTEIIPKTEHDHRVKELIKCKNDIVYFANHYFYIINLDTGLGLIELYPKQEELLKFMVDENRVITCAARQSGKSTMYNIFTLWLTIFHPEKKVMIAANKSSTASELIGRIKLAYEHLPMWLKCGVDVWNAQEVKFTNLSSFKGVATASDAARGSSCNCVIGDTMVTVRDTTTGVITDISMGELYELMGEELDMTLVDDSLNNESYIMIDYDKLCGGLIDNESELI